MINILSSLFAGTLLLVASVGHAQAAGAATITMTFFTRAVPSVGRQITCTAVAPQSGTYPSRPEFTYLTAGGNGVSVWNFSAQDGYTYQCNNRTALTPDGCYYWSAVSTGPLKLVGGETFPTPLPQVR